MMILFLHRTHELTHNKVMNHRQTFNPYLLTNIFDVGQWCMTWNAFFKIFKHVNMCPRLMRKNNTNKNWTLVIFLVVHPCVFKMHKCLELCFGPKCECIEHTCMQTEELTTSGLFFIMRIYSFSHGAYFDAFKIKEKYFLGYVSLSNTKRLFLC